MQQRCKTRVKIYTFATVMQKSRKEFLGAMLQAKGIRPTPFRLQVLDIIERKGAAINAGEIETDLGPHDRITLYRTLKTFTDEGVIHEIALSGNERMMALCASDCQSDHGPHAHQHAHFKCKVCGEVVCLALNHFPEITRAGYAIEEVEINLQGTCPNCLGAA